MRITKVSTFSGIVRTMDIPITTEAYEEWLKGTMLITRAFPHLTASEREFLLTGMTDEEWEAFARDDDEEDAIS